MGSRFSTNVFCGGGRYVCCAYVMGMGQKCGRVIGAFVCVSVFNYVLDTEHDQKWFVDKR